MFVGMKGVINQANTIRYFIMHAIGGACQAGWPAPLLWGVDGCVLAATVSINMLMASSHVIIFHFLPFCRQDFIWIWT